VERIDLTAVASVDEMLKLLADKGFRRQGMQDALAEEEDEDEESDLQNDEL